MWRYMTALNKNVPLTYCKNKDVCLDLSALLRTQNPGEIMDQFQPLGNTTASSSYPQDDFGPGFFLIFKKLLCLLKS